MRAQPVTPLLAIAALAAGLIALLLRGACVDSREAAPPARGAAARPDAAPSSTALAPRAPERVSPDAPAGTTEPGPADADPDADAAAFPVLLPIQVLYHDGRPVANLSVRLDAGLRSPPDPKNGNATATVVLDAEGRALARLDAWATGPADVEVWPGEGDSIPELAGGARPSSSISCRGRTRPSCSGSSRSAM